ncbi:MAG: response regulator [Candidatus Omnitrophota bacterium]
MNPKILVVDDEPDVCETIKHYFDKRGYEIITAGKAQEAIYKLITEKPALVLLDIRMADIDGIECLRIMKKFNKDVVVIMVTANDDVEIAKTAMAAGAKDYITKPIGFTALETAITTYLFLDNNPKE